MYGRHIPVKMTDFYGSIKFGHEHYGSKAYQIVMKTPQRKQLSSLKKEDAMLCKDYIKENGLYVVAHSGYLFNIAGDPESNTYAVSTAVDDLVSVSELGGRGAVFHVGKHKKMGEEAGVNNMYFNVYNILAESVDLAPDSIFILETAAGQGTECCIKLEQLAAFREMFDEDEKKRIRFCLDTCHMFSAGYDLRTKKTVEDFEKEVDNTIGWDNVELFHFNDSKNGLNARVDRHEKIGEGYIGEEGLRAVAQLAAKYNIPLIMETPILKTDTLDDLKKEVDIVGEMYTS